MKRFSLTFLLVLFTCTAALPLAGQQPQHDQHRPAAGGGKLPPGWQVRLDNPTGSASGIRFSPMGAGFHVISGPAAIYYRPEMTKSGTYEVHATFTQMKPAHHPEAYGLFIGGSNLQAENQKYTYFLVRQTGEFLVKRRDGAASPTVTDWTAHAVVRKTDGSTQGKNTLAIAVAGDKVRFLVNGTEVASSPAAGLDATGIVGLRINHDLNVHIDDFGAR